MTTKLIVASLAQKSIFPSYLKKCDASVDLVKKQWRDFEKQSQKAAIKKLSGILKSE